ncbi:tRNA lysidine(34) synthetase TilS [Wohlfahrtiimonas populi]|uniref:tRNA lysidine(34) synthetase TilS n=1 Tax=Wohlfahrtiimonas populi TaxID=1940240 RepID=UPI00098D081A|nr:tRNA lysidine(34) synthetase TilS [Wohlfahrtiimonas populi]
MIPIWYPVIFDRYQLILNQYDHLYIGLSAGIDSNMLLHWLNAYRDQLPPITAIHVNHQWHGEDSVIWANFAKNSAKRYGFEFINYDVIIEIDQKGAEACGREARYIKFAETMVENGLLVVAHHRSDQAETVMYRLLRGSGTLGLGGMRDITQLKFGDHQLSVCRPFLSISKTELYKAGEIMNVPWMEDYTNHGTEEARNQIRNAIFPIVAQYFPHYEQTFARSAQLIQESDELLLEIAQEDYAQCIQQDSNMRFDLSQLTKLSPLRQRNVLRYWLKIHDIILEKRQFDEFLSMFLDKKPTSQSCFLLDDWRIRAFKNQLYLMPSSDFIESKYHYNLVEAENSPSLSFWDNLELELVGREDGLSFHPMWRDKSQALKKLLQEIELEPWLRTKVQILRDKKSQQIIWVQYLGLHHTYKDICQSKGYIPVITEEK